MDSLNLKIYKLFNKDLNNLSDEDLIAHYHYYGINENRIINSSLFNKHYPDFDLKYYRLFNTDLNDLSDEDLMAHYHFYGIN
jgi:hypothetical protein